MEGYTVIIINPDRFISKHPLNNSLGCTNPGTVRPHAGSAAKCIKRTKIQGNFYYTIEQNEYHYIIAFGGLKIAWTQNMNLIEIARMFKNGEQRMDKDPGFKATIYKLKESNILLQLEIIDLLDK